MKWEEYCRAHGIKFKHETWDDVEFTAPAGFVFPNESIRRIMMIDDVSDAEIISCLATKETET